MSFSENAWEIFNKSIEDYHILDNIDAEPKNPYPYNSLEQILYNKNWIDTIQWHLEDIIRDEKISPSDALQIKRRIDASNQKRTDLVEYIDNLLLEKYKKISLKPNAKINTETPAWALDRLSILALKVYHMNIEANREDAEENHIINCKKKLAVLLEQKNDLLESINQLILDIENGVVKMKTYQQMKMYNDENLNPILYQRKLNEKHK